MKVLELIDRLNRLVAEAEGDVEVVIDDNFAWDIEIGYRPGTRCIHIDQFDPEDNEEES